MRSAVLAVLVACATHPGAGSADSPRAGGRGAGSDHVAFCRAGIPYVFFWTPDRRCYHARCDTVDQLDVLHLGEIASFAGALVARLSESPGDLAGSRGRLDCAGHRTQ